jgi:hypothetical protein
MSAAAKDVSALQTGSLRGFDAVAGPAMAAMVLPTAMMMGGFVAMFGVGFAFARALSATGREETEAASAPAAPRLVVSNPPAAVAAPTVEAAKPAPAKPSGTPPKPATPGGTPPKPKAAKAVSLKDAPAAPKVAAVKAPVAEVPVAAEAEAAKPAPAKPTGTPPKPSTPGGTPPKPKSAAVSKAQTPAAVPAAKKVIPQAAKAPTIAKTSTAKGISLPKVSIQKAPGSEPGKN